MKKYHLLAGAAITAILAMPAASSQDDTGSMLKKKAENIVCNPILNKVSPNKINLILRKKLIVDSIISLD